MSENIDDFFTRYIYGWMFEDIEKMIKAGLNYPAALCISVYCEVLGKLYTQDFSKGKNKEKFESFLPFLGQEYVNVDNALKKNCDSLYGRLRCGLVHDYLLKSEDIVSTRLYNGQSEGVIYNVKKDSFILGLYNFYRDFRTGAKCLHEHMIKNNKDIPSKFVSGSSYIVIYSDRIKFKQN